MPSDVATAATSAADAPAPAVNRGNFEMRSRSSSSAMLARFLAAKAQQLNRQPDVDAGGGAASHDRRAADLRRFDRRGTAVTGAVAQSVPAPVRENRPPARRARPAAEQSE